MVCRNRQSEHGVGETMLRKMRKEVSQSAKAKKPLYISIIWALSETCETSEAVLISMLQKELDRKNEQLAVKDKQIEELNARLAEVSSALVVAQQTAQAAQALHAGTIRQQLTDGEADPSEKDGEYPKKQGWFRRWFRG